VKDAYAGSIFRFTAQIPVTARSSNLSEAIMKQTLKQTVKIVATAAVLTLALAAPGFAGSYDLLVSSTGGARVLQYDGSTGAFLGTFASEGGLNTPEGLAFGPDGNLYVSSFNSSQVLRFDGRTGALLGAFASLSTPNGLTFGADGNLYVSSFLGDGVLRFDGSTGAFLGTFASEGGLVRPSDLVFGPDGNLYVSSFTSGKVLRFDGNTGSFLGTFATTNNSSNDGLDFGPDGNLYVGAHVGVQGIPDQVLRFDGITGAFLGTFAFGEPSDGFSDVDFGPDGNLYVSASSSDRVFRYDGSTGAFLGTFASEGGLTGPTFLAFTPVPEPSTLVLVSTGTLVILGAAWRRLRKRQLGARTYPRT